MPFFSPRTSTLTFVLTMLIPLLSCHHEQVTSHTSSEASWEQRAWLDKTIRAVLYGKARLSPEEEEHLLSLSREAAVDELMQRPEFFDTVLDFNLYFQGSKLESLKSYSSYRSSALESSPALIAAIEATKGGDYFSLFDWKAPYLAGTNMANSPSPYIGSANISNETKGLTADQIRTLYIERAKADLMQLLATSATTPDLKTLCNDIQDPDRKGGFSGYMRALRLPSPFDNLGQIKVKFFIKCGIFGITPEPDPILRKTIAKTINEYIEILDEIPALINRLPKSINKISDFSSIKISDFPFIKDPMGENFNSSVWTELRNSSTNLNRRRAAYILKTYFCDDLTPINIVAPSGMGDHKHASDAGCAACHYKLDPMAGFFRYRGIDGEDFDPQQTDTFLHDDLLKRSGKDLSQYYDTWRSTDPAREWNVGYIRSSTNTELNDYGSSLEDLFGIIRRARESKVCLTKKMAAYVLGADQVYDGSWIDSLAEKFHQAAQSNAAPGASTQAFKEVYKSFVLSKTFTTPDPQHDQCYDFAPGVKNDGLPCAVAFIIKKNCASCHTGKGASGGLDFSLWVDQKDGKKGFSHTDSESGQSLPMTKTLERMKERLTTSDLDRQMPLMETMDPVERASLFKWIDSQQRGGL